METPGPRSSLLALFVLPSLLGAQQPEGESLEMRADLVVVVVDAVTGGAIRGARVRLLDPNRGVLTDEDGRYRFTALPVGERALTVDQYGFVGVGMVLDVQLGGGEVRVELEPRALEIEGLEVVTERIESMESQLRRRRNSGPIGTRVYDQERLLNSAAFDMVEFLEAQPGVRVSDCGADYCVLRRGRVEVPRVYIDEVPIFRGMDQLRFYEPHELHMVEVFAQGLEIRAYTVQFMERMVRRPMALLPVGPF